MLEHANTYHTSVNVDQSRGRKNFVFAFWYFYFASRWIEAG